MPATMIAPPAAEPVTLAEMTAQLRLDEPAEDAAITRLIAVARRQVETATRRVLMPQGWRVFLDRWPPAGRIVLPVAPVRAITAVTIYDALGTAVALAPGDFRLDGARVPPVLTPAPDARRPGRAPNGIEIDVAAGYANAAAVPEPLREAIRLLVAFWFAHRLDRDAIDLAPTPQAVAALIDPYRLVLP